MKTYENSMFAKLSNFERCEVVYVNAIVVKFNLQTDEDVENWIENELGKLRHEMAVEDEMALLDDVDNVVGLMEEYPDAEYMLAKLKRDYLE